MSLFGTIRAPRTIVIGRGQRHSLARFATVLGQRALIVTDARLEADPDFRAMADSLTRAGLQVKVYSATVAELPIESLNAAIDAGRRFGADMVIGIGGGSCLDAAKITALILAHGGKVSDYYGEFKVPGAVLPLVLLPTTAGTGSEVTPVAVVTDPERTLKVGIASPYLIPEIAICDPELTYSCPPQLTAFSGADALTHAIEAYTTARRDPGPDLVHEHVFLGRNIFSDVHASTAIRSIFPNLRRACLDGNDIEAREQLMLGATSAGLAFGAAGTAAAHAIQYPVGAITHTAHGLGVAVLLPYVMEFNRPWCERELSEIAALLQLSGDAADAPASLRATMAIDAVADLFASVGIPRTLAELGITAEQLPQIATQAMGITRLVKNNPRPLDEESMLHLVSAAFDGRRERLRSASDEKRAELT